MEQLEGQREGTHAVNMPLLTANSIKVRSIIFVLRELRQKGLKDTHSRTYLLNMVSWPRKSVHSTTVSTMSAMTCVTFIESIHVLCRTQRSSFRGLKSGDIVLTSKSL